MSLKFTTTEIDAGEGKPLELLFEFLDRELSDTIEIEYKTELGSSKYVGSLQTNQIQGIYLQPIVIKGQFYGSMIMSDGTFVTAKERSDQLGRLQGRPIKFFYENFKQIVIIESYKRPIHNMEYVEFELVLRPHDFQTAIKPADSKTYLETNVTNANNDTSIDRNPVLIQESRKIDDFRRDYSENPTNSTLLLEQNSKKTNTEKINKKYYNTINKSATASKMAKKQQIDRTKIAIQQEKKANEFAKKFKETSVKEVEGIKKAFKTVLPNTYEALKNTKNYVGWLFTFDE